MEDERELGAAGCRGLAHGARRLQVRQRRGGVEADARQPAELWRQRAAPARAARRLAQGERAAVGGLGVGRSAGRLTARRPPVPATSACHSGRRPRRRAPRTRARRPPAVARRARPDPPAAAPRRRRRPQPRATSSAGRAIERRPARRGSHGRPAAASDGACVRHAARRGSRAAALRPPSAPARSRPRTARTESRSRRAVAARSTTTSRRPGRRPARGAARRARAASSTTHAASQRPAGGRTRARDAATSARPSRGLMRAPPATASRSRTAAVTGSGCVSITKWPAATLRTSSRGAIRRSRASCASGSGTAADSSAVTGHVECVLRPQRRVGHLLEEPEAHVRRRQQHPHADLERGHHRRVPGDHGRDQRQRHAVRVGTAQQREQLVEMGPVPENAASGRRRRAPAHAAVRGSRLAKWRATEPPALCPTTVTSGLSPRRPAPRAARARRGRACTRCPAGWSLWPWPGRSTNSRRASVRERLRLVAPEREVAGPAGHEQQRRPVVADLLVVDAQAVDGREARGRVGERAARGQPVGAPRRRYSRPSGVPAGSRSACSSGSGNRVRRRSRAAASSTTPRGSRAGPPETAAPIASARSGETNWSSFAQRSISGRRTRILQHMMSDPGRGATPPAPGGRTGARAHERDRHGRRVPPASGHAKPIAQMR